MTRGRIQRRSQEACCLVQLYHPEALGSELRTVCSGETSAIHAVCEVACLEPGQKIDTLCDTCAHCDDQVESLNGCEISHTSCDGRNKSPSICDQTLTS